MYPTTGSADTYQLKVIYLPAIQSSISVHRTEDTYYIQNVRDLVSNVNTLECLSGRIQWETAIRQTFGRWGGKLLEVPHILGDIIGSAARLYALNDNGSPTVSNKTDHSRFTRFGPEVSGQGFIDMACRWLPELAASKDTMQSAVERSYDEAFLHFEKARMILQEMCGCRDRPSQQPEVRSVDGTNEHGRLPECCLLWLAITIIQLVRQISTLASMPTDMDPRRHGLEGLYTHTKTIYAIYKKRNARVNFLNVLDYMGLLDLAGLIFEMDTLLPSNDRYKILGELIEPTAAVKNGTCFVLESLIKLSDKPENLLRVHIIPGHLEWNGKLYTHVCDPKNVDEYPGKTIPQLILPASQAQIDSQTQILKSLTARPVVTEYTDFLSMSYEIRSSSGVHTLAPGAFCERMVTASTKVICSERGCRPFPKIPNSFLFTMCAAHQAYENKISRKTKAKPNILLLGDYELARCAALAASTTGIDIMQGRTCIACCARSVLEDNHCDQFMLISNMTVKDMEQALGSQICLPSES